MKVAVKDRLQALNNPFAHLHLPDISLQVVEESIMLWDPLHYLEACPSSDGAAAMVIGSEKAATQATADTGRRPAWIHGMAMRSEPTMFAGRDQVNPQAGRDCAAALYKQAGITNPRSTSTWPRSTCPSVGTSRCGSRTSASAKKATAGS